MDVVSKKVKTLLQILNETKNNFSKNYEKKDTIYGSLKISEKPFFHICKKKNRKKNYFENAIWRDLYAYNIFLRKNYTETLFTQPC